MEASEKVTRKGSTPIKVYCLPEERAAIEANAQARAAGKGAVAVEGRMVDQATVRLASQLWEQARHLQLI